MENLKIPFNSCSRNARPNLPCKWDFSCRWNQPTINAKNHSQHFPPPSPPSSPPLQSALACFKVNQEFEPLNKTSHGSASAMLGGVGVGTAPLRNHKSNLSNHKMTDVMDAVLTWLIIQSGNVSRPPESLGWWFSIYRKYQLATEGLPPPRLSSNNTNPSLWMQTWKHTIGGRWKGRLALGVYAARVQFIGL